MLSGESLRLRAGTLVHIPRRTVHGFQYSKGGGQMLEITGENARAALMFDALDRTSMDGPPDIGTLLQLRQQYGVVVDGS
ncbi:hypothetical protein RSO01_90860 [Reyranella soli]|uniref:Uncharacterized protein n=1 Tax=Reyranella soli TaxID=1230389 RepID=A0A512NSJ3_9HYPH|nr:hypothetical protein RSO01_90860 [Reyranella soli]